jgi:hypothetical protein
MRGTDHAVKSGRSSQRPTTLPAAAASPPPRAGRSPLGPGLPVISLQSDVASRHYLCDDGMMRHHFCSVSDLCQTRPAEARCEQADGDGDNPDIYGVNLCQN